MFKRGVFLATLCAALALPSAALAAPLCSVGDKAQVSWKGKWYSATVVRVDGGQTRCFIHYDGYDDSWNEWVGADRIRVQGRAAPVGRVYRIGDIVEVQWKGRWYRASILAVKGDKVKIHYDGYDNSWDEWVGPGRIR